MTSQLRHNYQASQAVLEADDVTTRVFKARLILSAFGVPRLRLFFTDEGWSAKPHSLGSTATTVCKKLILVLFLLKGLWVTDPVIDSNFVDLTLALLPAQWRHVQ